MFEYVHVRIIFTGMIRIKYIGFYEGINNTLKDYGRGFFKPVKRDFSFD